MKIGLFLLLCVFIGASCTTTKKGFVYFNYDDVKFLTPPYIKSNGNDFALIYQIDKSQQAQSLRRQVAEKIVGGKFYYYFVGITSFPEYDFLVSRPAPSDQKARLLFESKSVFWLNKDGSEIPLQFESK